MKTLLSIILILFLAIIQVDAASTFQGGVSAEGRGYSSRVIDKATGVGVGGAKITLPKQRYTTQTDAEGFFDFFEYFFDSTRGVYYWYIKILSYFGVGMINFLLEIISFGFEGFRISDRQSYSQNRSRHDS